MLVLFLYLFVSYFLPKIKLENGNSDFIIKILNKTNFNVVEEKANDNYVYNLINAVNGIEISKPISIVDKVFAYNSSSDENLATQVFSYIQNQVVDKPRVYIYNTHTNEGYLGDKIAGYDNEPGVILASLILQEKLNAKGIQTVVEERSAADYIKEHNIDYKYSYKATRVFLEDKLKEYNGYDLIIDLHRDALSKDLSTTTIDGKSYAKTLLVMNKNFPNVNIAQKLNEIFNSKYPTLSRGIYDKYSDDFNQDLNSKVILLEVGGNNNTIDEVINTIDAVANSIEELLK